MEASLTKVAPTTVAPTAVTPATATTLDQVPVGAVVDVVRVGGERVLRRRLTEMGLVRGERVRVQCVAPLGDPIQLRVKGYDLALRRCEARSIQVRVTDD